MKIFMPLVSSRFSNFQKFILKIFMALVVIFPKILEIFITLVTAYLLYFLRTHNENINDIDNLVCL